MTVTYSLAPVPKWYLADLTGKPLGAGFLYTYDSLNPTQFKNVYQDPGGVNAWPNPILFDENGTQGPFYWKTDSSNPTDTYNLEVYDLNGNLVWQLDGYTPPGSGGGGTVTEAYDIQNLIINSQMWRNPGYSAISGAAFIKLAPGAHAGLAQTPSNAGPDICFIKNNTAATDTLTFKKFTLGSTALTSDVTPVDYLNYACTNTPAGETYKFVQFPITRNVQNLTNQNVTVTIWARCNSGNTTLTLQWWQFFGDGAGATSSPYGTVGLIIQAITLTASWKKYQITTTVPNVAGSTLGPCGNDALFLQVAYPLGVATNIDFCKPCVFLGNISPTLDYQTYDMIDGIVNAKRTGFIDYGYDLVAPPGYLLMDDGTIGSAASGATSNSGLGASINTFPLYNWLWTNVSNPSSNAWCPVTGGLGASAIADFTANKPMALQKALGRALASAGAGSGLTARTLGQYLGEEAHALTVPELASHTHDIDLYSGGTPGGNNKASAYNDNAQVGTDTTKSTGSGTPHNNMQPTSFVNYYIKL